MGGEVEMMDREEYLKALEETAQPAKIQPVTPIKTETVSEELIFEEDPDASLEEGSLEMIFDDSDLIIPSDVSDQDEFIVPVHDTIAADDPITEDLPDGLGEPTEIKAIAALENECELHVQEKSALQREIVELQDSSEVNATEKIRALENECEQYARDNSALRREIEELSLQEGVTRRAAADVAVESGKRDQKLAELEKELGIRQKSEREKSLAREKVVSERMWEALHLATVTMNKQYKAKDGSSATLFEYYAGAEKSTHLTIALKFFDVLAAAEEAEKEAEKKPRLRYEPFGKIPLDKLVCVVDDKSAPSGPSAGFDPKRDSCDCYS